MYRNVDDIPFASDSCDVIIDNQTIKEFNTISEQVKTYKLVTNKYYLYEDRPYTEPDDRQYLTCQDPSIINTLDSVYDFVVPMYHFMAIISALLLFYFAYKLIIYPFFRKKI